MASTANIRIALWPHFLPTDARRSIETQAIGETKLKCEMDKMNYTRFSVFAGAVFLSVNLPAAAAATYRGHQVYHHGYRTPGGLPAYRQHLPRAAYRVPRLAQAYRSYRSLAYGHRFNQGAAGYRPTYASAQHPYRVAARPAVGGGGGMATFYDPGPRAPGFTAAHLSLPMGTRILVTNLANHRSVVVRIADRGPERWTGRILDLSRVAATSLGMIQSGVAPIAYHVVN